MLSSVTKLPPPIIDMHLHALQATDQGPPPLGFCVPVTDYPVPESGHSWDATFMAWLKNPPCTDPIWSPMTDDELMHRTLAIMDRRNVIGVTSGPLVGEWQKAAPNRIIPGLFFQMGEDVASVDSVRTELASGRFEVFGEVTIQYQGIDPSDASFDPYLVVAEELDVPVSIHIGTGPPGAPYLGFERYRAKLHSPLLLEEALLRHPNLRLCIAHAGWPMIDDLLALMWTHPQVYIDVGVISFALPRTAFHYYIQCVVDAGFGKRVMFGSDQMVWPEALECAIEAIETANFLTEQQKRNILYNNAVQFLRLSDEQIALHHGR